MNVRKIFLIIFIVSIYPFFSLQAEECPAHLFYISKSDNNNVLYYDANIVDGKVSYKKPISIYWIMGKTRKKEQLNFIEKNQFSVVFTGVTAGKNYWFHLENEDLKFLKLNLIIDDEGCGRVYTTLNNQRVLIKNVFAKINGSTFFIPNVIYFEIYGINENGEEISERFNQK